MRLPAGYLLPEDKTMEDVRQIDLELLADEGLDIESAAADEGSGETPDSDE